MPDGLSAAGQGGAALPLLPTLATALAVAALSFLCREPAAPRVPGPAATLSIDAQSFAQRAVPAESAEAPSLFGAPLTGALAFALAYPLDPTDPRPLLAARPAARIAVRRAARRPEAKLAARPVPPVIEAAPARPVAAREEPAAIAEAALPETGTPEAALPSIALPDLGLPDLALPFAPAARVVGEAAGVVRTGAGVVGSSVTSLIDRLN